jgi:hypothetical protein
MSAFRFDGSGVLTSHKHPIRLPSRPIHMTTNMPPEYILVAVSALIAIQASLVLLQGYSRLYSSRESETLDCFCP